MSYQVQELRFSHFQLRRLESIATVLLELAREKKKASEDYALQAQGRRVPWQQGAEDVNSLFGVQSIQSAAGFAKLDKKRHKVTKKFWIQTTSSFLAGAANI